MPVPASSPNFSASNLVKLKLPESEATWAHLDADLRDNPEFQCVMADLHSLYRQDSVDRERAQHGIDSIVERLVASIHGTFQKFKLTATFDVPITTS